MNLGGEPVQETFSYSKESALKMQNNKNVPKLIIDKKKKELDEISIN